MPTGQVNSVFASAQVGNEGKGRKTAEEGDGSWSKPGMIYMARSMDLNRLLRTGTGLTSGSAGSAPVAMLKTPSIARKSLR